MNAVIMFAGICSQTKVLDKSQGISGDHEYLY